MEDATEQNKHTILSQKQGQMKRKSKAGKRSKVMFQALTFGTHFYLDQVDMVPLTKVKPHLYEGSNAVRPDGIGAFINLKRAVYIQPREYRQAEQRSRIR